MGEDIWSFIIGDEIYKIDEWSRLWVYNR